MITPFKVLAITAKSEKTILCSSSRFNACVESVHKNMMNRIATYIVVAPNGKRMSIADQKKYLSFSQGVNNVR